MNSLLENIGSVFLARVSEEWINVSVLKLFFVISAVFGLAYRIFVGTHNRSGNVAADRRSDAIVDPARVTALVTKLAQESLGIGAHQLDDPMEKLRIPRGDFLRFLDDLEEDHGLAVPDSARSMSSSISGIVAALCRRS